ncbi:MAG: hypothetical protein ACD_65C00231G0002 [uncultured bacterium]|nr:MAG: hypothetical protein ACD_65C00231G0002 [uncultured bacterium]
MTQENLTTESVIEELWGKKDDLPALDAELDRVLQLVQRGAAIQKSGTGTVEINRLKLGEISSAISSSMPRTIGSSQLGALGDDEQPAEEEPEMAIDIFEKFTKLLGELQGSGLTSAVNAAEQADGAFMFVSATTNEEGDPDF